MCQRLKGKTALVTGAAQGIGEGIAVRFAAEGAHVVVNDMNLQKAEEVSARIRAQGVRSIAVKADVSKKNEVDSMRDIAVREFGRLDILVNNAGLARIVGFEDMTEEIWDTVIDVNLKGTFLCCLAFVPQMIKQRSGKIINMSSKSGKTGNTAFAAYCASKFGIIGLTQSLALDMAPYGINANAICPGIVFTPHWDRLQVEYAKKRNMPVENVREYLVSRIPLGRSQTPEDVANVAVFLASSESDFMTGQAVNITGGQEFH
jgi:acetoin reductase-like protein